MKIFCVIPTYNEEANILSVISELKKQKFISAIAVVDDGSSDQTYQLVSEMNIFVLKHATNRGQGAALKTGTDFCLQQGAEIIIHFDGDGQFQASDLQALIKPIEGGEADIAFGSRFMLEESIKKIPWLKRKIILPLARLFSNFFLGIHLTDPQSGLRAMTAKSAALIDWQQDRMAHCSEILFNSRKKNLKIKEVPITVIYHHYGQKISGGFGIIKELFYSFLLNKI